MTSTASHSATPPHRRPVPGSHGGVPGDALRRTAGPEGTLPVGAGPWSVRSLVGRRGRAALEVYQDGELADVLVAARLTPQLLRGARRSPAGGRARHVLAWGRLAADGSVPAVAFTAGRLAGPFRSGRSFRSVRPFGFAWPLGSGRSFRSGRSLWSVRSLWSAGPFRFERPAVGAEVVAVAGRFWLAWAEGPYTGVLVRHPGGDTTERQPLERVRRRGEAAIAGEAPVAGGASVAGGAA
ncbi:hypothetical protein ACFVHI_19315 [Kitasatospora sp. NPDC127121]|uniref:hypothetical protein n=1 Tax=Kitasatospora sp. NPDC127121 TaxID=3345371 RepID=UPI003637891B